MSRLLRLVRPAADPDPGEAADRGGALGDLRPWPRVWAANVRYAPYPAPWNIAQYPAASVPAGLHPAVGTPLAVQVVAPDGGESLILGLAAADRAARALAARAP